MSNFAAYGGMKYSCLQTRYEGHVGNRNPILGLGHTSYDEPNYDVEGRKGPGTRGPKNLLQHQEWQQKNQQPQQQQGQQHGQQQGQQQGQQGRQQHPNAATYSDRTNTYAATSNDAPFQRRSSFVDLGSNIDPQSFKEAAGGGNFGGGKKRFGVGENANVVGSGGHLQQPSTRPQIARDVNVNLRRGKKKEKYFFLKAYFV